MIALVLSCCVTLMNDWYDGPLSERMVKIEPRGWSSWTFEAVGDDAKRLEALSQRLERAPIHVLAPGNPYAGYGLQSDFNGGVFLVTFNWLVAAAIERAGSEMLESSGGFIPPPHESLQWGLDALRSMGIEPDIAWEPGFPEHSKTWEAQLAHDAEDPVPYDPSVVRWALEKLGAELPADLALVPLPPPPPPVEDPPPRTNAEMRAIFREAGLPIPEQYLTDE